MISPGQIRAARALLGMTQSELADASGVSEITIKNIEGKVSDPRTSTLTALVRALEALGVEFTNSDRPGIRMSNAQRVAVDRDKLVQIAIRELHSNPALRSIRKDNLRIEFRRRASPNWGWQILELGVPQRQPGAPATKVHMAAARVMAGLKARYELLNDQTR